MDKIIKLTPAIKDYVWGGEKLKKYGKTADTNIAETWELSFHKDGLCLCEDGTPLRDAVTAADLGENVKDFPFFPMLIKLIDAKDNLSVQVHPSDEYALKYENSYGKTEMWYIVDAAEGAGIYCGFKRDTSKEEFLRYLDEGKVEELLNFIPVKKGESYFIASGTVHAIGAGCLICEIQQNSNLTYRVYDYNRRGADGKLRELHVDKAVKVINFGKYSPAVFGGGNENKNGEPDDKINEKTIAECKYFRVREIKLDGETKINNGKSFTAITVVSGEGKISSEGKISGEGKLSGGNFEENFKKGDSYFISCGAAATLTGKATVIATDIPE